MELSHHQLHKFKKRTLSLKSEDNNIKVVKRIPSPDDDDDVVNIDLPSAEAEDGDVFYIDGAEGDGDVAEEVENDNNSTRFQEEDDAGAAQRNTKKVAKRLTTYGYNLVQGKMEHGMEDYIITRSRKVDGHDLGLFAIFDGHSGCDVAKYVQNHLFENILDQPDFWTNPKSAIKRAYGMTDDDLLESVVGPRGGSTAVTAILVNGRKLVVANVGDSRGVMYRNGKANQITVDHEPQVEKELVERRGGVVSKMSGNVQRVDGQPAMTRAFGDGKLKDHITAEPYIVIEDIDDDTEFIILASDGLWKVMSNQEACDCIREIENAQKASEELTKEALVRDSCDDLSCIVVRFH